MKKSAQTDANTARWL